MIYRVGMHSELLKKGRRRYDILFISMMFIINSFTKNDSWYIIIMMY